MTPPSDQSTQRKGRIAFVGTGLKSISHMTLESIAEIKSADRVFYHAADGVTAAFIQSLNSHCHDLYQYYGTGKERNSTYLQMAEVMLAAVRDGESVCGVFYGHPGVFVKAVRRVLYQSRKDGYEALMYPGITTMDYLFADLEVDPSRNGCQILDATDYYVRKRRLNTDSQVIMLQIGAFADSKFDFQGYKRKNFNLLVQTLMEEYGGDSPCTVYRGSTFPGIPSEKVALNLSDLLNAETQRNHVTGVSTLYIPPKTLLGALKERVDASGYGKVGATVVMGPTNWETAYTAKMKKVAEDLPNHQLPEGYVVRRASQTMLKLMQDIANDPCVLQNFQNNRSALVQSYPSLTKGEQSALLSGSIARISQVSKAAPTEAATSETATLAATSTPVSANGFLNSLLANGTTAKLYQTYYGALASGGTSADADSAVQTYINNCGYSGVTTDQVNSAIATVTGGTLPPTSESTDAAPALTTYPPFGTVPSVAYGCYQTFDSSGNASIYVLLVSNNSTYQMQVATSNTLLTDITASIGFNATTGSFFVGASSAFPYNGTITFVSCIVTYNDVQTTDFNVTVSLTPTSAGSPSITSTGRRSVYSSTAALQAATVDVPSFWAGDYACTLNSSTSATLTISADGATITFQGVTAAATFSPFYSTFSATVNNYTLLIYVQWTYFPLYAGSSTASTGQNLFGYYYEGTKPSSPNLYGNLGTTQPSNPPSPPQQSAYSLTAIAESVAVGVLMLATFEVMKYLATAGYNYLSDAIQDAFAQGNQLDDEAVNEPVDDANEFNANDDPAGDDDDNDDDNDDNDNDDNDNDNDDDNDDNDSDDSSTCFLTTAVVKSLGMPDNSEPLMLARYLRDTKMTSAKEHSAVALYYKVAPRIVERSTDSEWHEFWARHLRQITALIKLEQYDLAKDLYTFATADLIDRKVTTFKDVDLVNDVYNFGFGTFSKIKLPYAVRFLILKLAFRCGLTYQSLRLRLLKRKFDDQINL